MLRRLVQRVAGAVAPVAVRAPAPAVHAARCSAVAALFPTTPAAAPRRHAATSSAATTTANPDGLKAFFEQVEAVKKGDAPKFVKTGRSWRADELRTHTFEDLHKLWYVLLRERNLLLTDKLEARRQQRPFDHKRLHKVKQSMARLKFVVHERTLAFKAARAEVEAQAIAASSTPVTIAPGVVKTPVSA